MTDKHSKSIYVILDIVEPTNFQVVGGLLCIYAFAREEVRCLSLIVIALAHSISNGKHISFPLMYYVDSLLMTTRLIRWLMILLQQFYFT